MDAGGPGCHLRFQHFPLLPKPVSMKAFFPFLFKEVPNFAEPRINLYGDYEHGYDPPQLISQCVSSLSGVCHSILYPDLIFICARTDYHLVPNLHGSRKLRQGTIYLISHIVHHVLHNDSAIKKFIVSFHSLIYHATLFNSMFPKPFPPSPPLLLYYCK